MCLGKSAIFQMQVQISKLNYQHAWAGIMSPLEEVDCRLQNDLGLGACIKEGREDESV